MSEATSTAVTPPPPTLQPAPVEWWQIRLSARGRKPLFLDENTCRRSVRSLAEATPSETVSFCLVDEHAHLQVQASRDRVASLARALHLRLSRTTGQHLEPAWTEQVDNRAHLLGLVRYCVNQPAHHGLSVHPALWPGSCIHEIAGTRWIPNFNLILSSTLPRVRPEDLLAVARVGTSPLAPLPTDRLAALGLPRLCAAATAAACVPTTLEGNAREVVATRVVVAHLAQAAGFTRSQVSDALACTRRAVGHFVDRPSEKGLAVAVLRRLALEERAWRANLDG